MTRHIHDAFLGATGIWLATIAPALQSWQSQLTWALGTVAVTISIWNALRARRELTQKNKLDARDLAPAVPPVTVVNRETTTP